MSMQYPRGPVLAAACVLLALSSLSIAQVDNQSVTTVTSDPTGKPCAMGTGAIYVLYGTLFTCQSGAFVQVTGGGGASLAPFTTDGTNVTLPVGTLSIGATVPGVSTPLVLPVALPHSLAPISPVVQSAVLANLGRAPRVLIVGDSILNNAYIKPAIQAAIPNTIVEMRTYGGSQTPMALAMLATDVQVYSQTGNLLKNSSINAWNSHPGVTLTAATDPFTGQPVWSAVADGSVGQRVNDTTTGSITVPTGAPHITFSVEINALSYTGGITLRLVNKTGPTTVASCQSTSPVFTDHIVPARYYCTATTGYTDGDTLWPYIYIGLADSGTYPAGTVYLSKPLANVGDVPSVYHATGGTPEAAGTVGWNSYTDGIRRDLYDLVVVCIGTNDMPVGVPLIDHQRMFDALITGASQISPRVLVMTRPPLAKSDFSAWDTANDPGPSYVAVEKREALRHGAFFYDARAAFQGLVTAGTYSIAQLMSDTIHPTSSSISAPGMLQYANAIVAALNSAADVPLHGNYSAGPSFRYGCQVSAGTWTPTVYAQSAQPPYNPADFFGGIYYYYGHFVAPASTGGTCTYTIPGRVIGLIGVANSSTGGSVNVSIDGQPAIAVAMTNAGLTDYPLGYYVAGDLPSGVHTVTVAQASGTPRVIGLVSAP